MVSLGAKADSKAWQQPVNTVNTIPVSRRKTAPNLCLSMLRRLAYRANAVRKNMKKQNQSSWTFSLSLKFIGYIGKCWDILGQNYSQGFQPNSRRQGSRVPSFQEPAVRKVDDWNKPIDSSHSEFTKHSLILLKIMLSHYFPMKIHDHCQI